MEGLTNSEIREVKINLEAPNAIPEAQWCREILQQKLCVIILHRAQVLFHSGKFEFEGQLFKHCSLLGNHQYIFSCSISFLSIHFLLSHFDQVQKNFIVSMILRYNSHGQNFFYQFTTYKTRLKKASTNVGREHVSGRYKKNGKSFSRYPIRCSRKWGVPERRRVREARKLLLMQVSLGLFPRTFTFSAVCQSYKHQYYLNPWIVLVMKSS